MKIDRAIEDVQDAEAELAKRLRITGEQHAVEHDLYHLGHTLAANARNTSISWPRSPRRTA